MNVRAVASLAVLALSTACVTVQVYFPAARIQNLSEQIESEVRRKAGERIEAAPVAPTTGRKAAPEAEASRPRAEIGPIELILGIRPAFAAGDEVPAPDVTSPAIRVIIDSRAARVSELNRYKSQGLIGENNQALVEARGLESASDLAARAAVSRLVEAENKDRRLLFEEIASAEGVDRAQIPRIQTTYARTLRRYARPGDWVQDADGKWSQA